MFNFAIHMSTSHLIWFLDFHNLQINCWRFFWLFWRQNFSSFKNRFSIDRHDSCISWEVHFTPFCRAFVGYWKLFLLLDNFSESVKKYLVLKRRRRVRFKRGMVYSRFFEESCGFGILSTNNVDQRVLTVYRIILALKIVWFSR